MPRRFPGKKLHSAPQSFAELETWKLKRHGSIILAAGNHSWSQRQVHFPACVQDPSDANKIIVFYGGGSVVLGFYEIGRATFLKSDPFNWTPYAGNPIIEVPPGYNSVVGPDDVWYNEVEERFELYAVLYNAGGTESWQGLWYSDDGFTFTFQGVKISPIDTEYMVGNGAILRRPGTWYFYYTYRTPGDVLPGIRQRTSTDNGATWSTSVVQILSKGSAGSYDDTYIEGLSVFELGDDIVLNYGCAQTISGTITFQAAYASSTSPTSGFTKSSINPFFTKSASGLESTQISTAVYCRLIYPWRLFYQASNTPGDYNNAIWHMFGATLHR